MYKVALCFSASLLLTMVYSVAISPLLVMKTRGLNDDFSMSMTLCVQDPSYLFHDVSRQRDNACLFCMANEKTQRSSKSADHGSVIICLLSCNSSDMQRTDATLEISNGKR